MNMSEPALKLVETAPVEEKALSIVDQAKAVKVTDAATYTAAGILWKSIGDMIKEVKDTFDPICDKLHIAHREATAKRAKFLDPLTAAQKSVKGLMSAYDAEQERLRREEQARLEAIARAEEEARRKAEAERIEAERKAEEERLMAAAQAAEAAGDKQTADALAEAAIEVTEAAKEEVAAVVSEPVTVAPVVLPKATPKLAGGPVYRTIWKFRIINVNLIPRQYMVPDEKAIGGVIRSSQGKISIPGVTAYEERV